MTVIPTPDRKLLIDRSSPIPAYQQIASDMVKRIADQEWGVGEKIPSEALLAQEYEVSRVTLRQAMSQLERDSIIIRHQGKGAFIKKNPRPIVQDLVLPSVDIHSNDYKPLDSRFLSQAVVTAPTAEIAQKLNVSMEEPLLHIQRVFFQEGVPIGISNIWFAKASVSGFSEDTLVENSISKTLHYRYRYTITSIDNYIESVKLDALTASQLNTVYDASGIQINSQYLLSDNCPIEYSQTIWLSELTRFHYKISK